MKQVKRIKKALKHLSKLQTSIFKAAQDSSSPDIGNMETADAIQMLIDYLENEFGEVIQLPKNPPSELYPYPESIEHENGGVTGGSTINRNYLM